MKRVLIFVLLGIPIVFAQSQIPASDPQALSLAAQSLTAMTGGASVSDVTLTGNAIWIAGSDTETGSATLLVKGTGESRTDLNLSGGLRTEIRNDINGYPQGASVLGSGNQVPWPLQNCWINAAWFFPALSALAETSDSTRIFLYVGTETWKGVAVYHLRTYRYTPAKTPEIPALNQSLSMMDIYLDATSLLPWAFSFNSHPDDDSNSSVAVEVDFSNYESFQGILIPCHIQKFIWNGLALDIGVTSVVLNSGISDSMFEITSTQ